MTVKEVVNSRQELVNFEVMIRCDGAMVHLDPSEIQRLTVRRNTPDTQYGELITFPIHSGDFTVGDIMETSI